ncbi:MAG: GspE/PulE family protein [Verrucomicrobiota bacterium]
MSPTIRQELETHGVILSNEAYDLALQYGEEGTLDLIEYLIKESIIEKEIGCRIWSTRIGYAYVDPISTIISNGAVASLPMEIARKANVMPLYEIEESITVAMPDPTDTTLIGRLSGITGLTVSPVFCLSYEVADAIELHYSNEKSVQEQIAMLERGQGLKIADMSPEELAALSESESVASLVESLLFLAIKERSSDIHIEATSSLSHIRFRIDGKLQSMFKVNANIHAPLTSRIKILSDLDIAETRFPQDGRFSIRIGSGDVNFRVSVIPTIYGEKIVLRILAFTGKKDFKTLDQMLVSKVILEPIKQVIRSPNGMVFVTGPTGSGKSTTLYAALQEINTPEVNITTIEDPVETRMDGVNQSQANSKIGLEFSTLLRSLLRQDPDVILVGEVRDLETAKIATEAALTGHLVFATLHTNNAIQAVTRLVEIGIERYMVAPSILGVVAQRLAAKICEDCKRSYTLEREAINNLFYDTEGMDPPIFYRGKGCPICRQTGYRGRIAFHELLLISEEIREIISAGGNDMMIAEEAMKGGYRPLRYDGLKKALLGFTTIDEVERLAPV